MNSHMPFLRILYMRYVKSFSRFRAWNFSKPRFSYSGEEKIGGRRVGYYSKSTQALSLSVFFPP